MRRSLFILGAWALAIGLAPACNSEAEAAHLLYISDSSGGYVLEPYTDLASEALNRPVESIDWRVGGLSIVEAQDMVLASPEKVADAEIVVLWGNPTASMPGMNTTCMTLRGDPPPALTVDDWAPFTEDVAATIDAIWEARDNQPTAIRVMDLYIASPAAWEEAGIADACQATWTSMSEALRDVATAHGAVFVSQMDAYNGDDHQSEPIDAGLLGSDGIHPSPAGGEAMATALAAVGFEPQSR